MQTAALSNIETWVELHYRPLFCLAERLCANPMEAMILTQRTFLLALDRRRDLPVPDNTRAWLLSLLFHAFLQAQPRMSSTANAVPEIGG